MRTDGEILEAIRQKLANGEGVSAKWLRRTFGIGPQRAKRLLRESIQRREPEAFLQETGIPPNEWDVERLLVNKWGVPGAEQKQIKVWLTRKQDEVLEEIGRSLRDNPPISRVEPDPREGDCALLSLFDLHVGMLAWGKEVGRNYDTHEALDRLFKGAAYLLGQIKEPVSKIILPIGNDLLHADTHTGTTTAGTRVDIDSRWQKAFTEVVSALIRGPIAWAAEVAPVRILIVPGNHDYQRAFYLGEVLRWYYEGRELPVEVDNSPRLRKYVSFGRVLLGFTHGDWVKPDTLPLIMAQEAAEEWGRAVWREWVIGHFHRRREMKYVPTAEYGGVRVRVMPALAATDAWHYQHGFVGGWPEATLTLYDPQAGPIADWYWRPV